MPKPGWKSITIKSEIFEKFFENKQQNNVENFGPVAVLLSHKLIQHLNEKEKLRNFASKIEIIPDKFTECRLKPKNTILEAMK